MSVIPTHRLVLEPLDVRHAELLFDGLRDGRLYQFTEEMAPRSIDALRSRYRLLTRRRSLQGDDVWLNWAIKLVDERRYLGYVQATVYTDRSADIAYVLFYSAWGHGYAREAVRAMLDHLRLCYEVRVVRARTDCRNVRSIAVLKALEFRLAGRTRNVKVAGHTVVEDWLFTIQLG